MIKSLFLIVFILTSSTHQLFGEEDEVIRENMISSNFLSMLPISSVNFFNLSYTRSMDEESAYMIELNYPLPSNIQGLGLAAEYKWYPGKNALKGLSLSPRFSYTTLKDDTDEVQVFGFGAMISYQFIIKRVGVSFGFGLDYKTGPQLQEVELKENESNVLPLFEFKLAYLW